MLKRVNIYRPLPKNISCEMDQSHLKCCFDYKTYVNINKMCENIRSIGDSGLYDALDVFSKKHSKYKSLLYSNLETVQKEELKGDKVEGYYVLDKDVHIIAYKNNLYDAYHELLHLASSCFDKYKNILFSGFCVFKKGKRVVGEGTCEGYIQLLCSRDLNNDCVVEKFDCENKTYTTPPYLYSSLLCRQLEILVGKEEMEDMFFNDGFNRLKEFLMQYKSEKEVMKFFNNMDAAAIADKHKSIGLNNRVLQGQEFLQDICLEHFRDRYELFREEKIIKRDTLGFTLISARVDTETRKFFENKSIKR